MTNPPFGTKIDDVRPYVLEQFDLGHRLIDGKPTQELLSGQDPDKLFLERDLQYLREPSNSTDGGRMVIVLPRQNLSGAEKTVVELRKWILSKARILAIIDLPREAFQPHTGTKTSLVFLQKTKDLSQNYPIFMAVSEAVGHDRRGSPIYLKDKQGSFLLSEDEQRIVWNDLPKIYEQWIAYQKGNQLLTDSPSCFVLNCESIQNDQCHRMDAWYWDPNKNDLAKSIEEAVGECIVDIDRLASLVVDGGIFYPGRHKRNYVEKSSQSLPFYSGAQIIQVRPFDLKYQPCNYLPAKEHAVEKDWILITRSGSTGRVIIVGDDMAGSFVSEHVIRVICDESKIDPYYLYAFLASEKIGKILMEKGIYASVVDHLTPDFIGSLPIPRFSEGKEREIADAVRTAEEMRAKANLIFQEEIQNVEETIFTAIQQEDDDEQE